MKSLYFEFIKTDEVNMRMLAVNFFYGQNNKLFVQMYDIVYTRHHVHATSYILMDMYVHK